VALWAQVHFVCILIGTKIRTNAQVALWAQVNFVCILIGTKIRTNATGDRVKFS